MKLKLTDKKSEAGNAVTFYFAPDEPINWKPGQYLRYHLPQSPADERGENRFFSIASAPFEKHIQLTTKFSKNGSSFKKVLAELKAGDSIEAFGPYGYFTAEESHPEYVLIAGGIGITPFRAILMDLAHSGKSLNASLIYANRTSEAVFKEELENLAGKHPEFKIYHIISEEPVMEKQISENIRIIPGKIDQALIRKLVPDLQKPIYSKKSSAYSKKSFAYYISGPEAMVMTLEQVIWNMGIPKEKTRQDYFPGYEQY